MRKKYYDLNDSDFENLIVAICKYLLGSATQKFFTGKDGGRDARFVGTARDFPNDKHQSTGKFIVQAKHTMNPIAKMSDSDFFGEGEHNLIKKELLRVKKLIANGEIDHYIFFTNRRDSANKSVEIENKFLALGLKSATVYGIHNIDSFLKLYPDALQLADLDEFDVPLRIIPDEIAEVILSLKDEISKIIEDVSKYNSYDRTLFEKKCSINNVCSETKSLILRGYLKEFFKIEEFLSVPANDECQELYMAASREFNAEILERVRDVEMDKLINDLIYRLFTRDGDLNSNKNLTRTVIYYMFWNCDLGLDE